jgi:hypothetical protein
VTVMVMVIIMVLVLVLVLMMVYLRSGVMLECQTAAPDSRTGLPCLLHR